MKEIIPGNKEIIMVNKEGQIFIPQDLLKLWGLSGKTGELEVQVNEDGSATTRPIHPETKIPCSYLLELNEDMMQMVSDSYHSAKKGNVLSEDEIDKFFERRNKRGSRLVKFFKFLFSWK